MNIRIHVGLFAGLLMLTCGRSAGCPACNIHNYLASSVLSSTNIYHGRVLRPIDDAKAEVEVVKVLRGTFQPGQKVVTVMYGAEEHKNSRFIFSDPTAWPPTFEVLPVELEDEILFLTRGQTKTEGFRMGPVALDSVRPRLAVKSVSEAVKRVQGVSEVTHEAGLEFISAHHAEAVQPLLSELKQLSPHVLAGEEILFGQDRLAKLLKALLIQPSAAGRQFALAALENSMSGPPGALDWNSISRSASPTAAYLRDLLRAGNANAGLSNELSRLMLKQFPGLTGRQLAEVTAALVMAGYATPTALTNRLSAKSPDRDALALGLYWAGVDAVQWWTFDSASARLGVAKQQASREPLRKVIQEEQDRLARWLKKPS